MSDDAIPPASDVYPVLPHIQATAHIRGDEEYQRLYKYSIDHNNEFWSRMAQEHLTWFHPFDQVRDGSFEEGTVSWFLNGKLNACYNCIDRHAKVRPEAIAIIWEGNDPKDVRRITYRDALHEVCRFANALRSVGVKKGDRVCIYMPMVPEAAFAMLACARIGAIHIVVFAGFSASALRDRIVDAACTVLVTGDEALRGDKMVPLKSTADEALKECPFVKTVFVLRRTGASVPWNPSRDIWLNDYLTQQRKYTPCEIMDSEDILFLLHTSGSTGKPKGLAHTTGGYLTYAAVTHKYVFDYRPGDVWACMADVGWITGHTYILYGPLANGATTFMFEGLPTHPGPDRYWDMVARHHITGFYTAPTALRTLMRNGDAPVLAHVGDSGWKSLRVLGSVGEPINPEAWRWYYGVVGRSKCAVVDTYWQTETGGVVVAPLPGSCPMKPGSACKPFFGIELGLVDGERGTEITGNGVTGVLVLKRPWPGMARTIYGAHERYVSTYLQIYSGLYFTGDRAIRDKDGYYWVTGRVDDVMNVSGHRIGSAEVEGALVEHPAVAEAAVVGIPHPVKGQALVAYVSTKLGVEPSDALLDALRATVRRLIGGLAVPDVIVLTTALPKTRSGKIMRRLLRKIAEEDTSNLGDITTLADPSVVEHLIQVIHELKRKKTSNL